MEEERALIAYLDSEQFVKASTNASRLVGKLKSSIQRKELYETHQILRTVYFRFVNVKDKVISLKELLYLGSCYLLKQNEDVSGQDIATVFLEAAAKCLQNYREDESQEAKANLINSSLQYHSNNRTLDWDISQKVATMAALMPDTQIGQSKYIAEALRILHAKLLNTSLLHNALATNFWQQTNYATSRYHYLHCASLENAPDIGQLLVEYQTKSANKSEADLFITQFVLQFLCLQTPLDASTKSSTASQTSSSLLLNQSKTRNTIRSIAEKVFSTYTLKHPLLSQICIPFSSLPLLNFTYFIISLVETEREAQTFKMLCDIYRLSWSRDPNYKGYLDRIGTVYFGIVDQSKQRQGGFFNNILMSLLEGNDDDDEDSNQNANTLSSDDELD